ncbi:phosphate ABC transporter ATP-binding protein [Pyrolobus fumarii]|nr:phosphate ABC transporter ATP-binding protein [Pyrolobus fumarii]
MWRLDSTYAVELEKVSIYYGGKKVVKNVTLKIPRNTVFAIMGPSGSGKSTLLRSINRMLDFVPGARVEGSIRVLGVDIYAEGIDPIEVRRLVGMVFQMPNPFPHMSIYENVALGPRIHKMYRSKKELDEIVRWALEKAALWDEVKDRLHEPASKLSGGQQQRLCIARALALKPRILLMDEPTANLDPIATSKIEELIAELKKEVTIIIVTHSPRQAARVADYVAFIYKGELVEAGPTKEVFTRPKHELTEKFLTGAF